MTGDNERQADIEAVLTDAIRDVLIERGLPSGIDLAETMARAALDRARDARHGTTTAEDIADFIERYPERWGHGPARLAADIRAEFAPGDTPHPTDTAASEQNADGG